MIYDNSIIENYILQKSTGIFEVFKMTWNHLNNSLKAKGINKIHIFLNIMYLQLIKILHAVLIVNTNKIRINVEDNVNQLVEEVIKNNENNKIKYLVYNINN